VLNFRQVEAFRAVMLSLSMTQAAKELHTSQPNISRVIAQLERRIGLKLFERHAGKLVPTLEGQVFFRDVERTFAGLRGLEDAADAIRRRGAGRLRIASVPSMAIAVAPEAINIFARSYPDVDISLEVTDSVTVCQWVSTGYADVGIASEIFNSTSIEHEVIHSTEGVCIVHPDHRLASRKRPVTPADLAGEKFLSLRSSDVMRKQIDNACLVDGQEKRILGYETHFAAALCHMVSCGMGVSIANPLIARDYGGRLVMRPFAPAIRFPTYLVYPLNSPMNMLARAFAGAMRQNEH